MSATGRKRKDAPRTEVAAFEFYPTPRDTVLALIDSPLLKLPGGVWIEPCAGSGRINSTVNSRRDDVRWLLCEIDERHRVTLTATCRERDALLPFGDFVIREWPYPRADVLLMNPPFSHALAFVQAAMDRARTVVMLQRTNWACPARASWLAKHAPDMYVLADRPSFTGDGKTDMADYSWFVWPEGEHDRRFGRVAMLDDAAASVQAGLFGESPTPIPPLVAPDKRPSSTSSLPPHDQRYS